MTDARALADFMGSPPKRVRIGLRSLKWKLTISREDFENICDLMRCADILTPESTYGEVAFFVLNAAGVKIEENKNE